MINRAISAAAIIQQGIIISPLILIPGRFDLYTESNLPVFKLRYGNVKLRSAVKVYEQLRRAGIVGRELSLTIVY